MRLAAYVRVSTKGQADDGLGRVDQERKIKAWARRNGHTLCGEVAFEQASGAKVQQRVNDDDLVVVDLVSARPVFVEAMRSIREGRCEGLVMLNLGRLSRVFTVQEAALAMVWASGGHVFTVDAGEVLQDDPADPMRTAIRQMMGVFHQLDRAMIVARLQGGRQVKAQGGGYAYGAPRFGVQAKEHELVDDPAEQAAIARILELHEGGASLRVIARTLDSEGLKPKRGGNWHSYAVSRVLERAKAL
jgi:DNA invertase Pin-like site-specific DNA recombinase